MLASERFGQEWARHWPDLARYGDSAGCQHDNKPAHGSNGADAWFVVAKMLLNLDETITKE